jgi:outer membrane protein OmpA-like peptidoglycan-associated protein
MNKIILFILLLSYFFYNCLFAQKTIVSNFIKIPPFARAAGMGEAFVAISDGTYGLYYNPAALSTILGYEIQFSNIYWLQNINYWYLGLINPDPILDWGKIGLSFSYFKVNAPDNIPENSIIAWNEFEEKPEYLGNYSVNFASSIDFSKAFSIGINLKWTYDFTDRVTGSNFSIGLGALNRIKLFDNNLKSGLIFSSNGPKFRLIERGISLPDTLTTGISYEFNLFERKVILATQFETESQFKSIFNSGIEFMLNEAITLRGGIKRGAYNCFSFGAGYKNKNIEFDYAFESYENYGNTHYFSFILTWGTPSVKFSVVPFAFSPNGDGNFDTVFLMPEFRDTDFIKNAKIKIFKEKYKYLGEIPVTDYNAKKIEWVGKINGKILKDGLYYVSAEAEYVINGSSESEKEKVLIDTTPPEIKVIGEPKYLKPGQDEALLIPATFSFFAEDESGIGEWEFKIIDDSNNVFFSLKGEGPPPLNYVWDGKGNNGNYINTGEFYYFTFSAIDNVGNKAISKPQRQLVLLKEIKLTFSSEALFEFGKANVKIESYTNLKKIKEIIGKYPDSEIIISGFTDGNEYGEYKTEEELSLARAEAVKFFIENMLNITDKKITTFGYGSKFPVDKANTEEAKKKNRRVEIIIRSTIYK